MQLITQDDFVFYCAVVVLDFLIRHGYIMPDTGTFSRHISAHFHCR